MREGRKTRRPLSSSVVPLITGLAAVLLVLAALAIRDARAGDRFDLVRWQVDTFPNRWVTLAGQLLRGADDEDEVITSYFAHPRGAPERRVLQPELQLLVERRVDLVVRDAGLDSRVPLPRSVFPPVNIQIAAAPYVLVTSPRAVIERRSVDLLRPDLPAERALEIERDAEGPDRSAIVLPTGGVATYPAIVAEPANYRGLLQVAAHEWVHHYLAFYPLGFRYFESPDLRAINETVADIIGDEVAAMVLERWGDPTHRVSAEPSRGVTGPAVDVASVLRDLRIEADALLASGRVDEAERRMGEVRDDLEDAGVMIRRINQAYFAWFGAYAARPDAVDPLGEYLREIRVRAGSLSAFVELVRGADSRGAVEGLLVGLGGATEESR